MNNKKFDGTNTKSLRLQESHSDCITMERLLNQYDKEYMKMAMLKHEETFREQVYELHRLYRVQKMLMKDIPRDTRIDQLYRAGLKRCEWSDKYNQNDLELTLGPKNYYGTKGGGPGITSINSGPVSSSPSMGSGHVKGGPRNMKWGPEKPLSDQDRLNSSGPWLFQALTLNLT